MQRADGAAGAFIVKKPKSQDPHGRLYDYDRLEIYIYLHLINVLQRVNARDNAK